MPAVFEMHRSANALSSYFINAVAVKWVTVLWMGLAIQAFLTPPDSCIYDRDRGNLDRGGEQL